MNIDLKPCPVCGGEMKLRRVDRAIEKSYQTECGSLQKIFKALY